MRTRTDTYDTKVHLPSGRRAWERLLEAIAHYQVDLALVGSTILVLGVLFAAFGSALEGFKVVGSVPF
ncbi:MAG: hypothetical protein AB1640_08895 [bacterium]